MTGWWANYLTSAGTTLQQMRLLGEKSWGWEVIMTIIIAAEYCTHTHTYTQHSDVRCRIRY